MCCRFLFQGIFLTQGSNPHLLHWQADSLPLSHQGSPVPDFKSSQNLIVHQICEFFLLIMKDGVFKDFYTFRFRLWY